MNNKRLNADENDLIIFLSKRLDKPRIKIEHEYLSIKVRYKLQGKWFKKYLDDLHNLHSIVYRDDTDENIVESMQFYGFSNLLRMVSYSFKKSRFEQYLAVCQNVINDPGKLKNYFMHLKRVLNSEERRKNILFEVTEQYLEKPITVIDYGCGVGYTSYKIAQEYRDARIFLVDIETLILEFAQYRFRQGNLNVETIPVTKANIYPELPSHNLCIATEVMEHLRDPLRAFRNIDKSLRPGGLLMGDFTDHPEEVFHVNPDLSKLREKLQKYEKISANIYRKPI